MIQITNKADCVDVLLAQVFVHITQSVWSHITKDFYTP